jgi:hypothetical protein
MSVSLTTTNKRITDGLTTTNKRITDGQLGVLLTELQKSSFCWFKDAGLSSHCRFTAKARAPPTEAISGAALRLGGTRGGRLPRDGTRGRIARARDDAPVK